MRLIDADEILKAIDGRGGCDAKDDWSKGFDDACNEIYEIIKDALTIEPEVRSGRWITKDSKTAKCSCCGWWQRTKTYYFPDDIPAFSKCYRFCTSCGVQMDGGADNGSR